MNNITKTISNAFSNVSKKVSKPNKKLYEEALGLNSTSNNTSNLSTSEIPVITKKELSNFTHPFDLPSNGVFYENKVSQVLLMPLCIGQLVDIDIALKEKDDYLKMSKLFTIVNNSVYGISVFDLTVPDFYALCFELRNISYKSEPISLTIELEKESGEKYLDVAVLLNYKPDIIKIDKSVDSDSWDYPKIRDMLFELREKDTLTKLEKVLFGYVKGSTPEEKLNVFKSYSIDKFDLITLHLVKSYHGCSRETKLQLSNKKIIESEVQFSFDMFFPRIILESIR